MENKLSRKKEQTVYSEINTYEKMNDSNYVNGNIFVGIKIVVVVVL